MLEKSANKIVSETDSEYVECLEKILEDLKPYLDKRNGAYSIALLLDTLASQIALVYEDKKTAELFFCMQRRNAQKTLSMINEHHPD